MDATALRWILAVIGVVVILGVYLFSMYQGKLRRNAAIRTFTQEELESGVIEDEVLRDELSHINTMLDQEVDEQDLADIKIAPSQDARIKPKENIQEPLELPALLFKIRSEHRVVHILKPEDGRVLTSEELNSAFVHAQMELQDDGMVKPEADQYADFAVASLDKNGSLADLNDAAFCTHGLVCFFDYTRCESPIGCYELMLKKIDELVRILDLKVYDEALQLLTLQHVTDTRSRINRPQ